MGRKYDAVVFDLDGTLLDTLEDLYESINAVLRNHSMPERTLGEIRSFVGDGILMLLKRAVPDGEDNPEFEEIHEEFLKYYDAHCMDETEPYPGILHLLTELKNSGIRTAIVSNKADFAVEKLSRVYFGTLVDAAIGDREGARRKPEPDSVYEALDALGVSKEKAVYVGDSDVDLTTAENAGMPCVLVTWGFRSREELLKKGADPAYLAGNVNELLSILKEEG